MSDGVNSIMRWLGALSYSCKEVTRLQSVALDGRLSLPDRMSLRCHLLLCKWCRRYGRQIKFLRAVAREDAQDGHPAPARGLSPEARERIQQRLRSEKG
jgi:hypothetical protein